MANNNIEHFYAPDIPRMIFNEISKAYGIGEMKTKSGNGGTILLRLIRWDASSFIWSKKHKRRVEKILKGVVCLHTLENGNISFYFSPGKSFKMLGKSDISGLFGTSLIRVFWKVSQNIDELNKAHIMFPQGKICPSPEECHILNTINVFYASFCGDRRFSTFEKSAREQSKKG